MTVTKKEMIEVAKLEIAEWTGLPDGLVLAILFAYVERLTTGQRIEELFHLLQQPNTDYEI